MKQRFSFWGFLALAFAFGIAVGAYLFIDVRTRDIVALEDCKTSCLKESELLGLLVSVGLRVAPSRMPGIVKETDRVVAIKSPEPLADIDYVVFPKKDIRHLSDLSVEDSAYLADAFLVMGEIAREQGLINYKVITNGPGFQQINYLHFHLLAE